MLRKCSIVKIDSDIAIKHILIVGQIVKHIILIVVSRSMFSLLGKKISLQCYVIIHYFPEFVKVNVIV